MPIEFENRRLQEVLILTREITSVKYSTLRSRKDVDIRQQYDIFVHTKRHKSIDWPLNAVLLLFCLYVCITRYNWHESSLICQKGGCFVSFEQVYLWSDKGRFVSLGPSNRSRRMRILYERLNYFYWFLLIDLSWLFLIWPQVKTIEVISLSVVNVAIFRNALMVQSV